MPGQKEQLKLQFYVEENWDNKPLFKKEGGPNCEKDYYSKWLIIGIKETIWVFHFTRQSREIRYLKRIYIFQ